MILKCSCYNRYQDTLHGQSMRVHNPCKSKSTGKWDSARCTVCGSEKQNVIKEVK